MPTKKFRNVRWDKRRDFMKSLEPYNLNDEAIELIDIVSNKNIVVVAFNSLLREKNIKYKDHINEANLIKLYVALSLFNYLDLLSKKTMINEIKKMIKKIDKKSNKKPEVINQVNWEEEMIKGYKLTDEEKEKFFSLNENYTEIAEVFSDPFNDQRYFDFAYLLNMYVFLEAFFNKYNVPENVDIFLIKIEVQQKMIQVLSDISPKNFNSVVITLNKWFKKFDKKFYELLNRKKKD